MSLIPAYDPAINYGFFGYSGAMCDRAIRSENVEMLKECIDRGWIDSKTEVLGFPNVVEFCRARGYVKSAEVLAAA